MALAHLDACREHGYIRKMKQGLLKEAVDANINSSGDPEDEKQGKVPQETGRS